MITVLIADNQALTREGIIALLSPVKNISVVGCADTPGDLQKQINKYRPGVVVMDRYFGTGEIVNLAEQFSSAHVLILSNSRQRDEIKALIDHGIKNYVSKACTSEELIEAIYATAKGQDFICDKTRDILFGDDLPADKVEEMPQLSAREAEIVHLIAEGLANKEIAERLFLSIHTIKTHRKNIIKKLGFTFKNAAELATISQSLTKLI